MKRIIVEDLRTMAYGEAWNLQEEIVKKGIAVKHHSASGDSLKERIPNYLLLCQHPHVYTLGKHGNAGHLLVSKARLKEEGIAFYRTNRGGDITYHGPGQLVAYPILDLEQFIPDLKRYMRSLEEVVIRVLAEYKIKGERLPGATGVWLDPDIPGKARKICAMGVRCSRWITLHGLALNINTDLRYFDKIVPCGIADKKVAGMDRELGRPVDEAEVSRVLIEKFAEVFDADIMPAKKSLIGGS